MTDNWRHAPTRLGEQKDFEVYSCHVSPDGSRLATAAGGKASPLKKTDLVLSVIRQMDMFEFGQ